MPHSEKSNQIVNQFNKYVKTGDKSLIKNCKKDEIEFAILQCHTDKGWPAYEAMERRAAELKDNEKERRNIREKWIDRIIGFICGIIIAIIGCFITYFLTQK